MKKWMFPKKTDIALPTEPVDYPIGTCVSAPAGYFYINSSNTRLRIPSVRVLDSWRFQRVVHTSNAALTKHRIKGKLGFRQGSLIYNIADGKLYLISDNKRRHITSPEALERIGAVRNEAVTVSNDDMNLHLEGDPLN